MSMLLVLCSLAKSDASGIASTSLSMRFWLSQTLLNAIAQQLNQRPRNTLGLHNPAEMLNEYVASIG